MTDQIYDEVVLEMANGSLYKISDIALGFNVGDRPSVRDNYIALTVS